MNANRAVCEYCGTTFGNKTSLKHHQVSANYCLAKQPKKPPPEYKCRYCDFLSTTKTNTDRHMAKCSEKYLLAENSALKLVNKALKDKIINPVENSSVSLVGDMAMNNFVTIDAKIHDKQLPFNNPPVEKPVEKSVEESLNYSTTKLNNCVFYMKSDEAIEEIKTPTEEIIDISDFRIETHELLGKYFDLNINNVFRNMTHKTINEVCDDDIINPEKVVRFIVSKTFLSPEKDLLYHYNTKDGFYYWTSFIDKKCDEGEQFMDRYNYFVERAIELNHSEIESFEMEDILKILMKVLMEIN